MTKRSRLIEYNLNLESYEQPRMEMWILTQILWSQVPGSHIVKILISWSNCCEFICQDTQITSDGVYSELFNYIEKYPNPVCRSCIFYRACMDIPRGTELLVWYNDSYTSFFGIPLQCIAQDENCKLNTHLLNKLCYMYTFSDEYTVLDILCLLRSTDYPNKWWLLLSILNKYRQF